MRRVKLLAWTVLCCSVAGAWSAAPLPRSTPSDLKGKTLKRVFDELLPGMGANDPAARKDPQQQWQALCLQAGAPGNEARREEACRLMADKLGPQTPAAARVWLLQQLQYIGRGECVKAVAAVLGDDDEHVHDAALRCLASNPDPAATAELAAKLSTAADRHKVGLLNALAYRADQAAIAAVGKQLASPEAAVARAAAQALGKIGTPDAARALSAARRTARGQVRSSMADGSLRCADRLLHEGKIAEAAAIYRELNRPQESRPIRLAALRGALQSAGDGAGGMILEIFGGADVDAQAIASSQIEDLGLDGLKTVAAGVDRLPPTGQVGVLGALAARGGKELMPVARAAVRSQDESVRQAGVLALGRLGDVSAVPLLVDTLFSNPRLAGVARESLVRVTGPGVNEKLLALLQAEKDPGKHTELISVLENRKVIAAVPLLLQDARAEDARLRARAMSALKQLAEPSDVPAMLPGVLAARKGQERQEAELAVAAVCGKILEPQQRADPVLAVFQEAGRAEKVALLPLLGRLGGSKARAAARAARTGGDPELAEAGLHALCNWPDPSVSEDLLQLAQDARDPSRRLLALQALIRVNSILHAGADADRLAMLQRAMRLAARVEERRKVLDGLATVRDVQTLRFVVGYLDDKDLAQQACKTVVELAHHKDLREPHKAEFDPALDRVMVICKDKGLLERAQRYKQGF